MQRMWIQTSCRCFCLSISGMQFTCRSGSTTVEGGSWEPWEGRRLAAVQRKVWNGAPWSTQTLSTAYFCRVHEDAAVRCDVSFGLWCIWSLHAIGTSRNLGTWGAGPRDEKAGCHCWRNSCTSLRCCEDASAALGKDAGDIGHVGYGHTPTITCSWKTLWLRTWSHLLQQETADSVWRAMDDRGTASSIGRFVFYTCELTETDGETDDNNTRIWSKFAGTSTAITSSTNRAEEEAEAWLDFLRVLLFSPFTFSRWVHQMGTESISSLFAGCWHEPSDQHRRSHSENSRWKTARPTSFDLGVATLHLLVPVAVC